VAITADRDAVIIGAGFGGIAAAIQMLDNGITNIEILESSDGFGGTWRFNDYPGAACDVPSHLYSFSFAQRRDWEQLCPTQPAILSYVEGVARDHGLEKYLTPNSKVTDCSWDDNSCNWRVTTSSGSVTTATAVVVATGQLHQPLAPNVPGLDSFSGHLFHSAQWDQSLDLTGKRVAVIGTGASAVQFVPEIAKVVGHLEVFQRTGNWFMPRRNRFYPKPVVWAIKYIPGLQTFRRNFIFWYGETLTAMIRHPRTVGLAGQIRSTLFMRSQVKDPELRKKIWPNYQFGCKRVLFSSYFLEALQLPNVSLTTDAIERISPDGVITADGATHEADVIILGTGFKTNDFMFPMELRGQGGINLRDAWSNGPHAHLGMSVPGFPSLFLMYGPNTNTSGGSILVYLEAQAAYIRQALEAARDRGASAVVVRPDVESASDTTTQDRFKGTAWTRCDSWYRDAEGRIVANWPGYMHEYVAATEAFDPTDYEFVGPIA
jgi:cation diffusion facilitator CzcD-associated flavoprotein CzcO